MPDLPAAIEDRYLRYLAAGLAIVVGSIHLFHPQRGVSRLVLLLRTDNLDLLQSDPRALVFTLTGLAILWAVLIFPLGLPRKPTYAVGMVIVSAYLVGYFAWHLTGHGGFLPGRVPHYHGLSPVGAVIDHLQRYPLARISKIAEAVLLVILAILYRRES